MNSSANPLVSPLDEIFRRLNYLWAANLLLDRALASRITRTEQALQEYTKGSTGEPNRQPVVSSETRLQVPDLTTKRFIHTSNAFEAIDEGLFQTLEDLQSRTAGWTFALSYEAFETFLFDIAAVYLFHYQDDAEADKLRNFETVKRTREWQGRRAELEYWKRFVRSQYRGTNNKEILKLLRRLAENLNQFEKGNSQNRHLTDWYAVASVTRHAITHSEFVIEANDLSSITPDQRSLLSSDFQVESGPKGHHVRLTEDCAKNALSVLGSYAYLIFKTLSQTKGLDSEHLKSWSFNPA